MTALQKFISSWHLETSGIHLPGSGHSARAVENSALDQRKLMGGSVAWTGRLIRLITRVGPALEDVGLDQDLLRAPL